MSNATAVSSASISRPSDERVPRPVLAMLLQRVPLGIVTIWIVTMIVFAATQLLPGNAALAVLGKNATPERLAALEKQMGLDQSPVAQYWHWFSGLLQGDPGRSLVNQQTISSLTGPQVLNSAALVVTAGILGTLIGVAVGLVAAVLRDSPLDHALAATALAILSLPEFVIAIFVTVLFSTNVFHWFPAVSALPPGARPWDHVSMLVLPTIVLVIVIAPYVFRMMRAATVEALESEYGEMAGLKGLTKRQVLLRHALPNAVAPTVQAIGLNLLYLAGGIVVVESVYNYPGVGQALYQAILNKDVPTIQFLVTLLAAFYVIVNIITDVLALMATPRRRLQR
ncbi:ABC transporter permease [Arthrobacter sp. 18067]|uniref:ABC transporter permease n=2 Tax=Micrococcaceae TaxID=1268 RepID=UPI001357153C|nr:ABC transporter permease [Arthrobacter sp. 18067]